MSIIKSLLLPPTLNALLILMGLLLGARRLGGGLLIAVGLFGLLALSTPVASHALRQSLEIDAVPTQRQLQHSEAIVILGGGRDVEAPEFGWGDSPTNTTWRRLAYGVHLHRKSHLPILVSGGRVHGEAQAEAALMAAALNDVFEVRAHWLEGASRDTRENARYSADILREAGITQVVLVSQAWHLPRAVAEFERAGLTVTPAATDFASPPPAGWRGWRPQAYHLNQSTRALHEWLGIAEQRLRETLSRF